MFYFCVSQSGGERNSSSGYPRARSNERHSMILRSDGVVSDLVGPVDAQRRVGSRSDILVLSQEGGIEAIVGCVPWKSTCRINDALEIALEVDDSGVRFPRTSQVGLE